MGASNTVQRICIRVQGAKISRKDYVLIAQKSFLDHVDSLCADDLIIFLKKFNNDPLLTRAVILSGIMSAEEVMDLLQKNDLEFNLCESAIEKYRGAESFIISLITTVYKKSSTGANRLLRPLSSKLTEDAKIDIAAAVNGDPKIYNTLSLA